MNKLNWDIDELVGKIMDDLRRNSVETSAAKASAALTRDSNLLHAKGAQPETKQDAQPESSAFVVSERVLVADVVRRIASQTDSKQWTIQPNAVVTPSAKDEMKKLGVETVTAPRGIVVSSSPNAFARSPRVTLSASNVSRETPTPEALEISRFSEKLASASTRVLIATYLPEAERFPSAVREYLERNAETTEIRSDCLKELTSQIADELNKDNSLKVILATHDAAIGSIWANRHSGVRAVVAHTFDQARRDLSATNANVAIVDPRDVGPYPFRQIVDYFLRQ